MNHGTRTHYQLAKCRCLPCRAANAAYIERLRRARTLGRPLLGQYVSASEAWARIRVLRQEGFAERQITGWPKAHHTIVFDAQSRVRLKTLQRLRALCQQYLIEDTELPNHQPQVDGREATS